MTLQEILKNQEQLKLQIENAVKELREQINKLEQRLIESQQKPPRQITIKPPLR